MDDAMENQPGENQGAGIQPVGRGADDDAGTEASVMLPWDCDPAAGGDPESVVPCAPAQAPILALDADFNVSRIPSRALPSVLLAPARRERSAAWTIPVMCIGMAIIAACLIVPATDTNRRLAHEQTRLKMDLQQLEKQIAVNDEFLHKVKDDPTLAQRLALRQLKMIRSGTTTLDLKGSAGAVELNSSPFSILAVPPPPQRETYQPRGGLLSRYCLDPKLQIYLIGLGLMLVAGGLILGASTPPIPRPIEEGATSAPPSSTPYPGTVSSSSNARRPDGC